MDTFAKLTGAVAAAGGVIVAGVLGVVGLSIAMVTIFALYFAWAGQLLYNWFVPTLFDFMPTIGFVETYGIMLVLTIFHRQFGANSWSSNILNPIVLVGVGYAVQRWFM